MSVRRSPQPPATIQRLRYFSITITLAAVYAAPVALGQLTTQAPPAQSGTSALPQAPQYPDAVLLLPPERPDSPVLESDAQSFHAGVFTLDGHVVITAGARRVEADHIVYDSNSGELTATGNLLLTGGPNAEVIHSSRGTFNLKTATGRFYDVTGSVGLRIDSTSKSNLATAFQSDPIPNAGPNAGPGTRANLYSNDNPFLFSARMVVKTGPRAYDLYDGTVTSCQLPHPDWLFSASHFQLADDKLTARNSTFRLLNVPILFLPYVTHPSDSKERQSGLLIPTFGQYDKSGSKGVAIGEQIYLVLGRSADLVLGAEYFSSIGFAQNAAFRYKGRGPDFFTFRYTGVLDRRTGTANQGGEDALAAGRFDFTPNTRAAANIEYLSSYIYREAFSTSFNQAVNSDIVSTAYLTHTHNGYLFAGDFDRYQGIKLIAQGTTPQQQVRIFHAPSLLAEATDHPIPHTPLLFSYTTEFAALKRTQPNFATGGLVERLDLRPRLELPLHLGALNLLPALSARETAYTRSRFPAVQGQAPVEDLSALSRSSFDFTLDIRPPVLTRTFASTRLQGFFGDQLRHTIEPELSYRLTKGISDFNRILRFDETDVASNTNEAEYGVTQRLFRRRSSGKACTNPENGGLDPEETVNAEAGSEEGTGDCRNEELISWRLSQKFFFDQNFGNALVTGRRNIFETTLNFSGIAFLTEPRASSPILSRLRVKSSASTDFEWDFDLDAGAKKFTSSNVFIDYHHGPAFTALSYARLDAPGRFYTEGTSTTAATGVSNNVSDFNQIRYLAGYGNPARAGLSVAANVGLDLKALYGATSTVTAASGQVTSTTVYPALVQYAALQTSYNWNCCGLSVEYRKFELGSVRNENSYRFNFTLVNIGSAGNLRKAERLF